MRVPEYRVYIPHLQLMKPVKSIHFDLGLVMVDLSNSEGDPYEYDFDEVILMQYTGIRDENGVKIYEGDVVQYKTIYEWDKKPIKRDKVIYEHGEFRLPGVIIDLSRCTVIGNAYENEDLIERRGKSE